MNGIIILSINFLFFCISIVLICFVDFIASQNSRTIISFCAGEYHTCAVFNSKMMKCWGLKSSWGSSSSASDNLGDVSGELGNSIPFIDVGTGIGVEQVSCGLQHVCMKLDTGDMKCLGSNGYGQMGMGLSTSTNPVGSWNGYIGNTLPAVELGNGLKVLDIALGEYHACVLVSEGKAKCFGYNLYGNLGIGNKIPRGRLATEMGENLPFADLGTGVKAISIHSGAAANHNCVILSAPANHAQRIKCWGKGVDCQLGYGSDNNGRGDESNEMGDNLPLVDLGTESKVKQISFGETHTCALLVNDGLKCFGSGSLAQLGSGSGNPISSTGNSMPFVPIDSGKSVKFVSTGEYHNCIVYNDMTTMKCFGWNNSGQLGQGDTTSRGYSPTTTIPFIPAIDLGTGILNISSIYSGTLYNCVVFVDSSVKCFGLHGRGQFAIGSTNSVGDGTGEMGDKLKYSVLFSPTKAPTNTPTLVPIKEPTKNPTFPTQSPTIKPSLNPSLIPTRNPSQLPTTKPTLSPTQKCNYASAKLCKYDYKCIWKKLDGMKQCTLFDCAVLTKGKCGKERRRCKWNKKTSLCEVKTVLRILSEKE